MILAVATVNRIAIDWPAQQGQVEKTRRRASAARNPSCACGKPSTCALEIEEAGDRGRNRFRRAVLAALSPADQSLVRLDPDEEALAPGEGCLR